MLTKAALSLIISYHILSIEIDSFFWLCWFIVAVHGISLVVAIRGDSLVAVRRLLLAMASLISEHGSRAWRLQ